MFAFERDVFTLKRTISYPMPGGHLTLGRVVVTPRLDPLEQRGAVLAPKGQLAHDEYVGEDSERPEVDRAAVASAREELGRAVGGRAAAGGETALLWNPSNKGVVTLVMGRVYVRKEDIRVEGGAALAHLTMLPATSPHSGRNNLDTKRVSQCLRLVYA